MDSHNVNKGLHLIIDEIDALISASPGSFSKSFLSPVVDPANLPEKFLLAIAGDQQIALPMGCIGEIGTTPEVFPLPNLPSWITGIVNVRGEIMTVIDLSGFLGVESLKTKLGDRFVVLLDGGIKIVVLIDRILGTAEKSAAEQDLAVTLPSARRDLEKFIRNGFVVDDRPVYILDTKSLLASRRLLDHR